MLCFITFVQVCATPFTSEEMAVAHNLMVNAHSSALLPPSVNDDEAYRKYLSFISRGSFSPPHRTQTTVLSDAAALASEQKVLRQFHKLTFFTL